MIRFLCVQEAIEIHDQIISSFGGSYGLRDLGLLASAIETPKAKYDKKYLHQSIFDKAAAYLFHICKNHPFIDGNKRTATVCCLTFLEDNNINTEFNESIFVNLIINTAMGKTSKQELSEFLKKAFKKT
jgi:death on curing protein